MSTAQLANIAVWIDSVAAQHNPTTPPNDDTPPPSKQQPELELDNVPDFVPRPFTPSVSSSEFESHHSGRCSLTKQLQALEDFDDQPVVFCNFDDDLYGKEPEDVTAMRRAVQALADGIGILAYNDVDAAIGSSLREDAIDRQRLRYAGANDRQTRGRLGMTPDMARALEMVKEAQRCDRGTGESEDTWNSKVQLPLLTLAQTTGAHQHRLGVRSVKTARIEPPSLSRAVLPRRVIDYVVTLEPDSAIRQAWQKLSSTG